MADHIEATEEVVVETALSLDATSKDMLEEARALLHAAAEDSSCGVCQTLIAEEAGHLDTLSGMIDEAMAEVEARAANGSAVPPATVAVREQPKQSILGIREIIRDRIRITDVLSFGGWKG